MATILIVDDSWLTRRGARRIITEQGHGVIEAENGSIALKEIETSEIDCIVLDLLMPEMDGFEFLARLDEQKIKIPVVVLTADIQNTVRKKCLDLGVNAFVNKPPEPENFVQVINEALKKKQG